MQVTDELVEKIWSAGARTRKYPKKTIRQRIMSKWRRILQSTIDEAKREAHRQGHRLIILESKTRCLMQSWSDKGDDIFYAVDLQDGVCTCPAFEFNSKKRCKHLEMFAGMLGADIHQAIDRARKVELPPSPNKIVNLTDHLRRTARERAAHG